jgi:hypothetical protein
MSTPVKTCAQQSMGRYCSVEPMPPPIAKSAVEKIMPIGFGTTMSVVMLGVLGLKLYRQYRARVIHQQIATLERSWQKTALEENSF